jgi:hypothetical protein
MWTIMDDGQQWSNTKRSQNQKQLPTLVGPVAGSFVQRLCQFISLGPKLPTASGGPGRISDGLLEAINLLMLMKKSCVVTGSGTSTTFATPAHPRNHLAKITSQYHYEADYHACLRRTPRHCKL